ncbi:septum formation initiator family protein [Tepidiforma sp.]|uniref:FtsB family cell division protein n=1 Tax=Tepidiforma sp. TaxID=2682230 RepID=UPI002ADD359A|nr:septum formation initiator family protein [Tepidiforma sp.]
MRPLPLTRTRLAVIACVAVALYFVYTAAIGAYRTQQLNESRREAEAEVRELEAQKAYLEAVRAYVASDAYVEQEARRRLGYVREGEIPFVVISPPAEQQEQPTGTWWERLFPR